MLFAQAIQKNNSQIAKTCMLMALALMVCVLLLAATVNAASTYITTAEATNIAVKHAGFDTSQVQIVKAVNYQKHYGQVYKIIFLTSNAKYIYEINAANGSVLTFHHQGIRGNYNNYNYDNKINGNTNTAPVPQATGNYIGTEKAKEIALNHARVFDRNIYKFDLELENKRGVAYYDIEFVYNGMEYEYKIDATTGDIIYWEYEYD